MSRPDVVENDAVIGRWQMPLDRETANRVLGLMAEHPEYVGAFEPPFFVLRAST